MDSAPRWQRRASIMGSARWVLIPSAIIVAVALARMLIRGRRARSAEIAEDSDGTEPRVRQFLRTGSHRMPEPDTGGEVIGREARSQLEEQEAAVDLGTLNAFLADVRDGVGADEAVYWRWSEE